VEDEVGQRREFLVYESEDGALKLQVELEGETVWLTQDQIATLFASSRSNVTKHIRNIYSQGELEPEQTSEKKSQVVENGSVYQVQRYNLDVIVSVGYRVNSIVATRFRRWATQTLKEYIVKGFVMDDKRLAEGNSVLGKDYFDELTERVRAIRMSERRFYEKVLDVFAKTSYDYDPKSTQAVNFFASIQNKFHYAVTGKTAAEIITSRIDASKPNAGLTSFMGYKPTVQEAKIAKNYMLEDELRQLYLISEQFLSFAELKMQTKKTMTMADWQTKLDEMLRLNDLKIVKDKGRVSNSAMENRVKAEMKAYSLKLPKPNTLVQTSDGVVVRIEDDRKH
jgi:hypothetical protein